MIKNNLKNSKLKNSIVLRRMASNVVDEAIVILKPNVKVKNMQLSKKSDNSNSGEKGFIVEEAESVINEYVNKLSEKEAKRIINKLENKVKILKIVNVMFLIVLIISVVLGILLK